MSEVWRPVVGFEGFYEVSSIGRVRSIERTVTYRNGLTRRHASVMLSPRTIKDGYQAVGMSRPGRRWFTPVHKVVLMTFVGPRPDGMITRHLDGNPANNRLENLTYGTPRENNLDRTRHGTDHNARKTHCPQGHEYTPDNTWRSRKNIRYCRACWKQRRGVLRGSSRGAIKENKA